jgi:hypothetical protein
MLAALCMATIYCSTIWLGCTVSACVAIVLTNVGLSVFVTHTRTFRERCATVCQRMRLSLVAGKWVVLVSVTRCRFAGYDDRLKCYI